MAALRILNSLVTEMVTEDNQADENILGLSTSDLAGLSAEELTDNPTAIKMLLHYYRQLVDRLEAA